MKNCQMCGAEKEEVNMVQVAPATWNGFNDFAEVCAECQTTKRFKDRSKSKKAKAPAGVLPADPDSGDRNRVTITISHKRTGALLQIVESHTLVGVCLANINLSGADLQHAALRNADLQKADLHLADLAGADLRGADLRGVNLRGADLREADLREARLFQADLNHALYDNLTRWPGDFDPRACGARSEGTRRHAS